jgi:hypothetical protein
MNLQHRHGVQPTTMLIDRSNQKAESSALAPRGRTPYLHGMPSRTRNVGTIAMIVALIAILAAALWYAASAWFAISGPPMPAVGYVAMILGIVVSLAVGVGLMALLFYSSRHGYDEPYPTDNGERE